MSFIVDTSRFQPISEIDGGDDEETALLQRLADDAEAYVRSLSWAPPVEQMFLAFGIGGILGLFLVRFVRPVARSQDQEFWIVVGDLPNAYGSVEDTPTPRVALEFYCYAMEDWAKQVLSGGDLSQVYPLKVEPTEEHANMLLSRIEFIRTEFIPVADKGPVFGGDAEQAPAND